ncbi:DUF6445 family protein [Viridibacillus arvi]|uniref:DUF6445 family protein n=1 Tax=Viridibacillus arvi TaxID=263475 RepID=UPI003D29830B
MEINRVSSDIFVIDNFYDSPYSMRDIALTCEYLEFKNSNIPGFESVYSFYNEIYASKFSEIIEKEIYYTPSKLTYGKFRYSLSSSLSNSSMHIDKADWSCVVYLSLDEDVRGGLGIYAHIETGLKQVPQNKEDLDKLGFNSLSELDKQIVYPSTNDFTKWNLLNFIPIKFNRAVIFKGSKYFHAVTEKFGNSIENSRLTHNFFFNEK